MMNIQINLTNFRTIFKQKQSKMAKILRGVTQLNFDKKAQLNVDKKKAQLRVDRKKEKKIGIREHRTYANRRLKPTRKTPTGGVMRKYNRSA
jgi:hypothetical protein